MFLPSFNIDSSALFGETLLLNVDSFTQMPGFLQLFVYKTNVVSSCPLSRVFCTLIEWQLND